MLDGRHKKKSTRLTHDKVVLHPAADGARNASDSGLDAFRLEELRQVRGVGGGRVAPDHLVRAKDGFPKTNTERTGLFFYFRDTF